MINRWLENEPKETLVCAVTSAIALVLSITGILKDVLPFDIAWVAIVLSCAVLTWFFTGEFMRAVTVLVVFCLCAFILATPTAVLAGIGNGRYRFGYRH